MFSRASVNDATSRRVVDIVAARHARATGGVVVDARDVARGVDARARDVVGDTRAHGDVDPLGRGVAVRDADARGERCVGERDVAVPESAGWFLSLIHI